MSLRKTARSYHTSHCLQRGTCNSRLERVFDFSRAGTTFCGNSLALWGHGRSEPSTPLKPKVRLATIVFQQSCKSTCDAFDTAFLRLQKLSCAVFSTKSNRKMRGVEATRPFGKRDQSSSQKHPTVINRAVNAASAHIMSATPGVRWCVFL